MDLYTDSIMTAKANTAQPQNAVRNSTPPTITYQNPTQQHKTEQKPAQRLKTEQEEIQKPQEEQPRGANDWNQSDWRDITSVGTIQSIGAKHTNTTNKRQLRKRGNVTTNMAKPKVRSWMGAFAKRDRASKINERSVAQQLPLMSAFT